MCNVHGETATAYAFSICIPVNYFFATVKQKLSRFKLNFNSIHVSDGRAGKSKMRLTLNAVVDMIQSIQENLYVANVACGTVKVKIEKDNK